MLQSYQVINLKTKREKYIPLPSPIGQFKSKKERVVHLSHNELTKILIHWVLEIYGYICVRYYQRQIFIHCVCVCVCVCMCVCVCVCVCVYDTWG